MILPNAEISGDFIVAGEHRHDEVSHVDPRQYIPKEQYARVIPDIPQDYPASSIPFPLERFVTNRSLYSLNQVENAINALPAPASAPDVRSLHQTDCNVEMVPLDDVVGGTTIKDWGISNAVGRGATKIYQLVNLIAEDNSSHVDLIGIDPIEVYMIKENIMYMAMGDIELLLLNF